MPETLKKLIDIIAYLPGIGEKSATKLAFFLLKAHPAYLKNFATHLANLQEDVRECEACFGLTDKDHPLCKVCSDPTRDSTTLCIVEDYLDMVSIERLGIYKGRYHVLGGVLSPIRGSGVEDLRIRELFKRLRDSDTVTELIIATNPNIEGEATALYIKENIPNPSLTITRLSKGLPNAGYIEYADEITLINAFKGRK